LREHIQQEEMTMADKYMWIRVSPHLDFSGRGSEPEVMAFEGPEQPPGAFRRLDDYASMDEKKFHATAHNKTHARFTSLLLCHDHGSPGCVYYYKRGYGWVQVCS
jgi:hypothetical protein